MGLIPEADVFLGQMGLANYQTPGTPENADAVGECGVEHQCVLMEKHGVITWGTDIEDAYWKMENADAYCRVVWVASQLGQPLRGVEAPQMRELIAIRKMLGMEDKRDSYPDEALQDAPSFHPGPAPQAEGQLTQHEARLVEAITQRVVEALRTEKTQA